MQLALTRPVATTMPYGRTAAVQCAQAGSTGRMSALVRASFVAVTVVLLLVHANAAIAKERVLAHTKFGDVVWGKKNFLDTQRPELRLRTSDGLHDFSSSPAWDDASSESTVAAQAEDSNSVALLLRSEKQACSSRYRMLLLRRLGRDDTIKASSSRRFGICGEGPVTVELISHKSSSGNEILDGVMAVLPDVSGHHQFRFSPNNSELIGSHVDGFEDGRKFVPTRTAAPCLSGICLGDGIAKHARSIAWSLPTAKIDLGNSPFSELYRIQDRIIGLPKDAGANIYLANRTSRNLALTSEFFRKYPSFRDFRGEIIEPDGAMVRVDGAFIGALSSPGIAFCRNVFLRASFVSVSGYPTWVSFRPDKNGVPRVVELIRQYRLPNRQSVEATTLALRKEYPFLPAARSSADHWGNGAWGGKYQFVDYSADNELRLSFSHFENGASDEQLSKNSACPKERVRSAID